MKKLQKSQFISLCFLIFFMWFLFFSPHDINLKNGQEITTQKPPPSSSPQLLPKPPNAKPNFMDDFDYNTTHPNWTAVKRNGEIRFSYPYVNITTFSGSNQDWWTNLYNAPYSYVTLPTGDFMMTTKLVNPSDVQDNCHVGLLLYENDQNVYFFGRRRSGSSDGVRIEGLKANVGQPLVYDISGTNTVQYYRITRQGTTYNFEFSHDGARWLSLVNYTATNLGFTPHFGGLVNKKSGSTGFSAYFEYFYLYDNHLEVTQQSKTGFYDATWNFENDTVGGLPAGWVTVNSPAQGTLKVVESWFGHNHVLELNDTGGTAGVGAYHMLGATISSGIIEYWVYLKNNVNCGLVEGTYGNASDYNSVGFRLHRAYGRWYASDVDTGVSAPVNVWHRVQISFGPSSITYIVDGTVVATRSWLHGLGSINGIGIQSGSTAVAYEAYYDAFGLSWQGYTASNNKYEAVQPANWSYYVGTTGNNINWKISDLLAPNPTYAIYRDGSSQQTGIWVSGMLINYDIDGLDVGDYNFTIVADDGAGEIVQNQVIITVVANQAPSITPRADAGFEACSIGRNIAWTILDDWTSNPSYIIKMDDMDFASGVWISNNPVIVNVDSLPIGQYNLTLIAADGLGESAQDEINVSIAFNLPPNLDSPTDPYIEVGTAKSWINWTITDCNIYAGTYTLYCNESLNATGTWSSGSHVAVNLTNLGIGRYNFTLVANDGWGATSQDEILVTVVDYFKQGYALVVGINDYPGTSNDLQCCIPDATGMISMLQRVGFSPANIYYLPNSDATEPNIVARISDIARNMDPNDVFVLYYSGHGNFVVNSTAPGTCSIHTPHNYPNNYDNYWTIHHEGALGIRVRFTNFNVENGYDIGYVADPSFYGNAYTGSLGSFWSDWILGDTCLVGLQSDYSITRYGFDVTQYEIMTSVNGSIVTYDYATSGEMWGQEIATALNVLPVGSEQYLIFDSCMSGGLIPSLAQTDRVVMAACASNEYSLEDSARNHGVFTYYLLQVFDSNEAGFLRDTNSDGEVSFDELFAYVGPNSISRSTSLGSVQHPQLSNQVSGGGNWSMDSDNDGLRDYDEVSIYHTDPSNPDSDGDYLPDSYEIEIGFDPISGRDDLEDTDSDGMINYEEYCYHSNPLDPDTDGDGLSDGAEFDTYGTSPLVADTDRDGMPDAWEVAYSFNPLLDDSAGDIDSDGLLNINEFQIGADPSENDTDTDGMPDGWEFNNHIDPTVPNDLEDPDCDGLTNLVEFQHGTHPLHNDTDYDGMPDGWEVAQLFNPLANDSCSDADNDGLVNLGEFQHGANPHDNDTDDDLIADGYEHDNALNIFVNDAEGDLDGDGLTNLQEFLLGTFANDSDSENDGMPDGWEVTQSFNPLANDASNDADSDALNNLGEYQHGANPHDSDVDDDLMLDGYEHDNGLNMFVDDAAGDLDSDGLTNYQESLLGTFANDSDSENDGMPDGWEILQSFNPLGNDAGGDADIDDLTNLGEYQHGANPHDNDTDDDLMLDGYEHNNGLNILVADETADLDGDGLTNYQEFQLGTYANDTDTENDGMPDGWEVAQSFNPLANDANADADSDALNNLGEYQHGANPHSNDTDGDLMLDGYEHNNALNILVNDAAGDLDSDGLTNFQESQLGTYANDTDTENDGMPDGWEVAQSFNPLANDANADADSDALNNLGEYQHGANPHSNDTDGDLIRDGYEHTYGLNLLVNDAAGDLDGDGLTNLQEFQLNTYANDNDTDNDNMPDGWEVAQSFNPLANDANADADSDTLNNLGEYQHGANPHSNDTDGDLIRDGYEHTYGLNLLDNDAAGDLDVDGLTNLQEFQLGTYANDNDTDNDNMPDGWEVVQILNPLANDANADPDADALKNLAEYQHNTNPHKADTDLDQMPDGWEVTNSLNPLTNDASADLDHDNLTNLREYQVGTSPRSSDTDGDRLNDGVEVNDYSTNPTLADTDGDGLRDGDEVLTYGTDPRKDDTDGDTLSDNIEIVVYHTDPLKSDTDDDGLADGEEIFDYGTSPFNKDSDGDLWSDGDEVKWGTDPLYYYDSPSGYIIAIVIGSVIVAGVVGAVIYRKRHPEYYRATPPHWNPDRSQSWQQHASPGYHPPSQFSRPASYGSPSPRNQGEYEYGRNPTYRGYTADQWSNIGTRAMADHRPDIAAKAFQIAQKLRVMAGPRPSSPQHPTGYGERPPAEDIPSPAEVVKEKFRTAASQYKLGMYDEARNNLRQVVKLDPSHAGAWHLLGMILRAQHEDVGAEQAFRNSLNRNPQNPDTWISLAEVYADSGRTKDAIDAANHALDVAPRAWVGRARVEELLNKIEGKQEAHSAAPVPKGSHPEAESKPEPKAEFTVGSEVTPAPSDTVDEVTPPVEFPACFPPSASDTSEDPEAKLLRRLVPIPPAPISPQVVIKKCDFCNNLVQGGECISCGARVCPHCGEMNFATAHTCVNCSKDL